MLTITAILAVRNDTATLARVLEHLAVNTIPVHVIDHGSNAATLAILDKYRNAPVVEVLHKPFDGIFRLEAQMRWKDEVVQSLKSDWVMHIDADEIFESPREGESLREMIERTDAEGFDVINCDEFMFVPTDESEDFHGTDFVASMRNYYLFCPVGLLNQRVVRLSTGTPEWFKSGGHRLDLTHRKQTPEKLRKRHYIGLSLDALRGQYLSRVFSAEELRRGEHHNRTATTPDFIVSPAKDRLFNLDRDGWRTDRPERRQLIFHQPKPYDVPGQIEDNSTLPPMPFIVGMGRSGTTLLRLLLDAHPALAIPPETHWLPAAAARLLHKPKIIIELRHILKSNPYWNDMGIPPQELEVILSQHNPAQPFDTLRAIYRHYAQRSGATRIGDKTPPHGIHMCTIARAFPEAHFIHIIRDGRDVAVSMRDMWWGPKKDIKAMAKLWTWRIREMRQQAQFVPHYKEVCYEELVANPEHVLREICAFIDLPFHPDQLRAHEQAEARLHELQDMTLEGTLIPADKRRSIFTETLKPPNSSRVGRWRTEMSAQEVKDFESIAGNMLCDLGYIT